MENSTSYSLRDVAGLRLRPNRLYVSLAREPNCGPRPVRVNGQLFHRFYTGNGAVLCHLGSSVLANSSHELIMPKVPELFLPDFEDPSIASELPYRLLERCHRYYASSKMSTV